MRILFDVRLLGPGGETGVEAYTSQLLTHLLTADRANDYLLFYSGVRKQPLPPAWLAQPNVRAVDWRVPNRLLDAAMRFTGLPAVDRALRADLAFSPHFTYLRAARAPRLITFHDLSFLHHPEFFSRRQRVWHALQDCRGQARAAAGLIAVSAFTKADMVRALGIPDERITVIHSGVDPALAPLAAHDPRAAEFRRQHALPHPFLLSLGTLEPRKNVPAVIRAWNLLKRTPALRDLRLVIAGRPGWLYRTILEEAGRSPFRKHIRFWGPVAPRDKLFLYGLAEAFAYPSFFEGFGFPPLEAQACGTPTVVANRTSLPEIVGGSALLVDPWRVDELASALEAILTNSRTRAALRSRGLANAGRFRWERAAAKTLHLIEHHGKPAAPQAPR